MAVMIRKQVYIRPDQESRLKRAAADEGVTEAEIIRRGIEAVLGTGRGPSATETLEAATERAARTVARAEALRATAMGGARAADPRASAAWRRVTEIFDQSRRMTPAEPSGEPEHFDREEAYAERLARLSG
jgi:hypothetical protein